MIEENAVIVGLENNLAMLEIIRRTPCSLCGQTRGCGISIIGRLFRHRNNVFKAINSVNATMGDEVVVGINEQALLMSAFFMYGVPLLGVMAGALTGAGFSAENSARADQYAVLGAVTGLALGLLWLKKRSTGKIGNQNLLARYQPVILRVGTTGIVQSNCNRGK